MKNHPLIFFATTAVVLFSVCACSKFDDSALWQAINKNAADIAALKEKTNNLNSDIISLQQLVAALQNHDYITNCTPLADGTGYTVAFNSGKSIVIRNGTDGKDGLTPQIGIAKDTDGVYYWTLNGSWLLDDTGNKVKADGCDGSQGVIPQLKIMDGYWYVSTDGGVSWTNLGKATGADGKDGNSFFEDVIVGTDTVTFILTNGTSIIIPFREILPKYEMVDLGLSVKWASFNLGASKPEEYGGYYQWAGLEDVTDTNIYVYLGNCPYYSSLNSSVGWTKYVPSFYSEYWSGSGNPDNKTVLDPEDDVAHVKLGGKWRIPTNTEFQELLENCSSEWVTVNGVEGRMFTSNKNNNSIFLPVAGYRVDARFKNDGSNGYYWSSSLYTNSNMVLNAYSLEIMSDNAYTTYLSNRSTGRSVRPVYGDMVNVCSVSLNKTSLNFNIGEASSLCATIMPSNAAEQSVSWSSDNTSVATVDVNGKVTAISAGTAIITVKTTDGGYAATCSISVKSSDTEVSEMVDLGLSVKWARCNLGASKPEEYGGYYQWAGLEDVTDTNIFLDWSKCPYHTGSDKKTGWTKYVPSFYSEYWSGSGNPDNKMALDPEDDVAYVVLGGNWRMPSIAEFDELVNNCQCDWIQLFGVYGCKFTSKKAGYTEKWIFLPAAGRRGMDHFSDDGTKGRYWSSTLLEYSSSGIGAIVIDPNGPTIAKQFYFDSKEVTTDYSNFREYGQPIRPVLDE